MELNGNLGNSDVKSKSEEEKPTFELDCHIFKKSEKKLGPGAEGAPYMLKWCGCNGLGIV